MKKETIKKSGPDKKTKIESEEFKRAKKLLNDGKDFLEMRLKGKADRCFSEAGQIFEAEKCPRLAGESYSLANNFVDAARCYKEYSEKEDLPERIKIEYSLLADKMVERIGEE